MNCILVTGGAGFIGTNLVLDRLSRGEKVRVLDNCDRIGTEGNWEMLERLVAEPLELLRCDVRDAQAVKEAVDGVDAIFHLAAQVAVTTSVADPVSDFEVNARGTLNVLEAARACETPPIVIYASTNKVYGGLENEEIERGRSRYSLPRLPFGIPETRQLDFHSPYGCSKGAADQYVLDYARIYGLRTIVFRQSCIYGPWQRGNEDQGWLAHFVAQALANEEIHIYGDGLQVRDVLYIGDLLLAYQRALESADAVAGRAYNIGGGPSHTSSLLEFVELLGELLGSRVRTRFQEWRPGDQRVYVSDIRRAKTDFGWAPMTPLDRGARELVSWLAPIANAEEVA
jgi:CDP-paratose 2-epimerase